MKNALKRALWRNIFIAYFENEKGGWMGGAPTPSVEDKGQAVEGKEEGRQERKGEERDGESIGKRWEKQ